MEKNKVILIGGDHYNGLGLVRLFGEKGLYPYGIIVGPNASKGFLKYSKYWEKVWTVSDDSKIIPTLEKYFGDEEQKPVLIPWSDGAASMIDRNLERLEKKFIVPSIGDRQSSLYDLMDKGKQVEFAHKCGLSVAQSLESDLDTGKNIDIPFPCIGKPIVSCEGNKKDIRKIENETVLKSYLEELKEKGYHRILLQEYVEIEKEYDIEGFVNHSEYAYFVSEKVRTWPDIGGPTAFCFSVNNSGLNTEIEKIVGHLISIGYSGLFDVEIFKVGDRYLFNEINWRNSAVGFAAMASGVDYPLYWYYSVTGQEYEIHTPEKYGVYAMVELLDFQHVKTKQISMKNWLADLRRSKAKAYYSKSDPAPLRRRISMFLHRRGFKR